MGTATSLLLKATDRNSYWDDQMPTARRGSSLVFMFNYQDAVCLVNQGLVFEIGSRK